MMKFVCYVTKIEFAVFKIKNIIEKYYDLVPEKEIIKGKHLCNEQQLHVD